MGNILGVLHLEKVRCWHIEILGLREPGVKELPPFLQDLGSVSAQDREYRLMDRRR